MLAFFWPQTKICQSSHGFMCLNEFNEGLFKPYMVKVKYMYMYLGFIVPVYSIQTGILFSVRNKLTPGTQLPMNHPDSCIQEDKHLN